MLGFFKKNFLLKTKEICVYLFFFNPKGCFNNWDLGEDLGVWGFFKLQTKEHTSLLSVLCGFG